MKIFTSIVVCILFTISGFSQNSLHEQYRFKSLTIDDGLPSNAITSICQDKYDRLWIGTSNSICMYDGYEFKKHKKNNDWNAARVRLYSDKNRNIYAIKIQSNLYKYNYHTGEFETTYNRDSITVKINDLTFDENGDLWIGSRKGLYFYNNGNKSITKIDVLPNKINATAVYYDSTKLYIGTAKNGIIVYKYLSKTYTHYYFNDFYKGKNSGSSIQSFYKSQNNIIWVGTQNDGLYMFNEADSSFKHHKLGDNDQFSKKVNAIQLDSKGDLWLGIRGGLYQFNEKDYSSVRYAHKHHLFSIISSNTITKITEDRSGVLWLGTYKGINYTNLNQNKFIHITAKKGNKYFLNSENVYAITKDKKGNMLIGTSEGGVNIFNSKLNQFTYLKHEPGNSNSLLSNDVKDIEVDENNNYWIATYNGLAFYNTRTNKVKHYKISDDFNSNKIYTVFITEDKNVWINTSGGIYRMRFGSDKFIRIYKKKMGSFVKSYDNKIYGCSVNKLLVYNNDKEEFDLIKEFPKDFGNITHIYKDSSGIFWIGRNKGLTRLNTQTNEHNNYRNEFLNSHVAGILEDESKNLWVSCKFGFCKLLKDSFNNEYKIRPYTSLDGLQSKQFNQDAYYKDDEGNLYFGGINGFNVFHPKDIKDNLFKPKIILISLKIFNQDVKVNEEIMGEIILKSTLVTTKQIELSHKHSVFSLEFAALDYASSEEIKYAYTLEGFDEHWNYVDAKRRNATYTNLPKGKYVFKLKSTNGDGIWVNEPIGLKIRMLPAWWQTWWFKFIITLFIGSVIYGVVKFILNKEKVKQQQEVNTMKLKFFTNVAHEFRTPLALINAPFEKLIDSVKLNQKEKGFVDLIKKNTKQMNKLIDEFLYLRQHQNKFAKLSVRKIDVIDFLKDISSPFKFLANERDIDFKFQTEINTLSLWFDPDKMVKIVNNLLMNAFKFTDTGGEIKLTISELPYSGQISRFLGLIKAKGEPSKEVKISIQDTGKGMSEEHLNKIFKRYYRVDEQMPGSGIGLELVNTLVNLHSGSISVQSEQGKGSTFDLYFKKGNNHFNKEHIEDVSTNINEYIPQIDIESPSLLEEEAEAPYEDIENNDPLTLKLQESKDKLQLLIVEDNMDLRNFLSENLSNNYNVTAAPNGAKGLEIALETLPDIIVSDIDMPELNGIEMCAAIKGNIATSHIPIILLSKRVQIEDEINGLKTGADDYIGKPFNMQYLLIKIRNILYNRQKIKTTIQEDINSDKSDALDNISVHDREFYEKCRQVIMGNLSNTEFNVKELCKTIGLSQSQFQRKLEALINQKPNEFIYSIRLEKAKSLLMSGDHTVTEVGDLTGFSSSQSFATVFKRKFGSSPREFLP